MFKFSIPQVGSSGHIIGGIILSSLLGLYIAFLSICSILLVQSIFFADGVLLALGCNIFNTGLDQIRVIISDKTARIEVIPDDFEKLIKNRKNIIEICKSYGFTYIFMDLQEYRTGSINETL